jgi:hypothetical protein
LTHFLPFVIIVALLLFAVGEPTPFSMLGSPTSSSFWIRSGKDPPLSPFLICLEKKRKKKKKRVALIIFLSLLGVELI